MRAHTMRGGVWCRPRGGRVARLWGRGTRGAHVEHILHGRDAGRVPAGNVRVETQSIAIGIVIVIQTVRTVSAREEEAHVGDG
eukprot:scaffold80746_cov54-Phaeocystis_antarctica.AAC.6